MSRYSGYPRWALLTKADILSIFVLVMFYMQTCTALEMHYR